MFILIFALFIAILYGLNLFYRHHQKLGSAMNFTALFLSLPYF
ncbi:hypothetical protein [Lonepinella sp. MS14437]